MSCLKIQNISKSFAKAPALDALNIDIIDGEFLVLVGPSGCGKSTLLRILAGLESVDTGKILLDNHDITDFSPKERNFAMIFQNYALFPHMTVAQNISFGMRIRKEPKSTHSSRVNEVAKMLHLDSFLDRKPAKLSGGQRQRVAMARAIVRNPKLFLMDEPLSNLDAKLRIEVRDNIITLHKQLKTTTVYVTHDQIEAMTMADRIVVLNNGKLQQIGTPEALYHFPQNLFVAGFIGTPSMNILPVSCSNGYLNLANQKIPLPTSCNCYSEKKVLLGIRPEHILDEISLQDLNTAKIEPYDISLCATISHVELLGAEYLITTQTTLGKIQYRAINRGAVPKLGLVLSLYFSSSDIHLFSPTTQQRLNKDHELC